MIPPVEEDDQPVHGAGKNVYSRRESIPHARGSSLELSRQNGTDPHDRSTEDPWVMPPDIAGLEHVSNPLHDSVSDIRKSDESPQGVPISASNAIVSPRPAFPTGDVRDFRDPPEWGAHDRALRQAVDAQKQRVGEEFLPKVRLEVETVSEISFRPTHRDTAAFVRVPPGVIP